MTGIADAHLHLFRHGYRAGASPPGEASEVDAYEALRIRHGVEAGLVIGYEADGMDPANNAYLRSLAKSRPWMATLAYVDAMPAPEPERIEALLDAGHLGLAVYLPDAAAGLGLGSWPPAIWDRFNRRRAVLSLNARPEATAVLEPVVAAAAGCAVLFSHLGLPGRHATVPSATEAAERLDPLLRLARHGHSGVKLSGLYAVDPAYPHAAAAPFVALLLDRFGPGRCHWGSDFSPALEHVPFARTFPAGPLPGLTREEHAGVMGGALLALVRRARGS